MNVADSTTLFLGGYMEQGDPNELKLGPARLSLREARNDAAGTAEPPEWRVVVEVEIVNVETIDTLPKRKA